MSRTKRGGKAGGFEWWSRRPGRGEYAGTAGGSKFGKRLTHKAERREGREQTKDQHADQDQ